MSNLDRFIHAHAKDHAGIMTALRELASGEKVSHWIWHVFPQVRGLSLSPQGKEFSLADIAEATEYVRHEALRSRYLAACLLVREWTRADEFAPTGGRRQLQSVMGGDLDALKLVSSLTLFELAAERAGDTELASVVRALLATASAQGLPRCAHTLSTVGGRD